MNFLKQLDKRYKTVLISVFMGLLLSHSMALFNKISFHDDVYTLFDVGGTYSLGRWGLAFLREFVAFLFGAKNDTGFYSLPIMAGIYSFLFVGMSVCLIVKLMDIKNNLLCAALGLLFISTPYFASLFGYVFTASYYVFALFLSIMGAYLICYYKKWYSFLGGLFLILCSLSIYQAFYAFALSLMLLYYIKETLDEKGASWRIFFKRGLYYFTSIAIPLALYLALTPIFCSITGTSLSDYQDINKMGNVDIPTYLNRIPYVYNNFLYLIKSIYRFSNIHILYWVLLGLAVILCMQKLWDILKKDIKKAVQFFILLCFLPLAFDFTSLVVDRFNIHILMLYSQIMFMVLIAYLIEQTEFFEKISYRLVVVCFSLIILMQIRTDNIFYLKAEITQTRLISYFTTLVTRIKSTEGYKDEYPVAYINERSKRDFQVKELSFRDYSVLPYKSTYALLNSYAWRKFVASWCGFTPRVVYGNFRDHPEVKEMPHYPDDGSIRLIDKVIVVKF